MSVEPTAAPDAAALMQARAWLESADRIMVLTGAGVSAESGVATFRDALTGLWEKFKPEDMATEAAYRKHPRMVWDWYQERRERVLQAQPNPAHLAIAALAKRKTVTLVTQNVDGLHQRAVAIFQPFTIQRFKASGVRSAVLCQFDVLTFCDVAWHT